MRFDGSVATFRDQVLAQGRYHAKEGGHLNYAIQANLLEVTMNRAVDLRNPQDHRNIDARTLAFRGPVTVDSRTLGADGQQESVDHMRLRDLIVDQETSHTLGCMFRSMR